MHDRSYLLKQAGRPSRWNILPESFNPESRSNFSETDADVGSHALARAIRGPLKTACPRATLLLVTAAVRSPHPVSPLASFAGH
jgi:hypothetical protein